MSDGPKPYKFIGFGDMHGPKPYKFIGFGDMHGPKPIETLVSSLLGVPAAPIGMRFRGSLDLLNRLLRKIHQKVGVAPKGLVP